MKMYVLDCGSMYLDESLMVAGINTASYRNQSKMSNWVRIPVCSYLIETDSGFVLYDTGCNKRESELADGADTLSLYVYSPGQLLPERLDSLNVNPEDVKSVVVSHLHCDHAGYLHLFKQSEIYVSDKEFTMSMKQYGLRKFGAGPYIYDDFNNFLNAGLKWNLLPDLYGETEIAPGVTVVSFGSGHTFGILGLLVELPESGKLLLCSDALYRSDNLGPPIRLPGLIYDSLGYTASAEFISGYAKSKGAKIIFGHDSVQFAKLLNGGGILF